MLVRRACGLCDLLCPLGPGMCMCLDALGQKALPEPRASRKGKLHPLGRLFIVTLTYHSMYKQGFLSPRRSQGFFTQVLPASAGTFETAGPSKDAAL